MTEAELEAALFPADPGKDREPTTERPLPDFAHVHEELQRHKHTIRQLLWEEYRAAHADGYNTAVSAICTSAGNRNEMWCCARSIVREREVVRRLGWRHHSRLRSPNRRGSPSPTVRGRTRRQQLHLRGSQRRSAVGFVDRRARARLRVLRRPSATGRSRYAKLRGNACVEDIDYRASRGLDRTLMRSLANDSGWVQRHENVFVIGPTGVGKSFLACALAQKACRDGHLVLYTRAAALFRDLALARADGSLRNLLARLGRVDVLA